MAFDINSILAYSAGLLLAVIFFRLFFRPLRWLLKALLNGIIPSSITSIGYCAFCGCTSLTNITFDGTVEEWNAVTFGDEWNLEVPATEVVCSDGKVSLNSTPAPGLYDANDNLVASWDELVNTYGMDLEKDYSSFEVSNDIHCLKNILLNKRALHPGSKFIIAEINEIGDLAFFGSERLTSIIIPDSVTAIGYGSFNGCTGLTSIVIGNNVTEIGDRAFYNCSELNSITIPPSVISIGNGAFSGCTNLKDIYITDIVAWCKISFSDISSNPTANGGNPHL